MLKETLRSLTLINTSNWNLVEPILYINSRRQYDQIYCDFLLFETTCPEVLSEMM